MGYSLDDAEGWLIRSQLIEVLLQVLEINSVVVKITMAG